MQFATLVTGANGNLGKAIADKFLSEGHKVYGTMLPKVSTHPLESHPSFQRMSINLLDEHALSDSLDQIKTNNIGIKQAVFTVGGFAMGTIDSTDAAGLDHMMKLNLYTNFFAAKAVLRHMRSHGQGGHIFLTAARQAIHPSQGSSTVAYTLSKLSILGLAEILNAEAAGEQIITHVIVPSIIDTPINRQAMPQADFNKWVLPSEIADAVYFHSSESAKALREPIIKVYGDS